MVQGKKAKVYAQTFVCRRVIIKSHEAIGAYGRYEVALWVYDHDRGEYLCYADLMKGLGFDRDLNPM